MSRWWKGAALAAWLGLNGSGQAQQPAVPSPVGAARMPEPIPTGPTKPVPDLVPGPISPLVAPKGPGPELDLPAGHTSAFQCENFPLESACYASLGVQWLQRGPLGKGAIAVLGPPINPAIFGPRVQQGLPPLPGLVPPPGSPVAQRYNDIVPDMKAGLRGTVGYLFNNQAIELTGYGVSTQSKAIEIDRPTQIDGFFHNAPPSIGPGESPASLFINADRLRTTLTTSLANAELNYRSWNGAVNGADLILGVRYLNVRDKLSIYTDQDTLSLPGTAGGVGSPVDIFGHPNPIATYTMDVRNHIVVAQIGGEYAAPLPTKALDWIYVGGVGKAGLGADIINTNAYLTRGDGVVGFNDRHTTTNFVQVYELGGFVDFHILDRLRFRAAYTALWMVGVGTTVDQIDFNLANPRGNSTKTGSLLYHGPSFELQFLF
jgi:hypothetical protein